MTRQDNNYPRQVEGSTYKLGDLVMVHGVNLGVIKHSSPISAVWIIQLASGGEVICFTGDFELYQLKEKKNGNDNDGEDEVCTEGG